MSQIICEKRIYTTSMEEHAHGYSQLILPLEGTLEIQTKDRSLELDTEGVFLLAPGSNHVFQSRGTNAFVVLDIPGHLVQAHDQYQKMDGRWQGIRSLLYHEATTAKPGDLSGVLTYIHQFLSSGIDAPSIEYLKANYHMPWTVKDLAAMDHMSPYYYGQWFSKHMGMTIGQYVTRLRLERAKYLMETTNLTITQIGLEVGYAHHSSFTRAFSQWAGQSPKKMQKHLFSAKKA